MGRTLLGLGSSILAGCKRSTGLARYLTVRAVKALAARFEHVPIYQHVDDVSNLIRADTETQAISDMVSFGRAFAGAMRDISVIISAKSVIMPLTNASTTAAKTLGTLDVTTKVAKTGTDLGVETSAARHKVAARQNSIIRAAAKKAAKVSVTAKIRSTAKRLGISGVAHTGLRIYGIRHPPDNTQKNEDQHCVVHRRSHTGSMQHDPDPVAIPQGTDGSRPVNPHTSTADSGVHTAVE